MTDSTDLLSLDDVADKFFWHIRKTYRNQSEAAERYGVSKAFISSVTKGKRNPTEQMLSDIGLKKISGYIER